MADFAPLGIQDDVWLINDMQMWEVEKNDRGNRLLVAWGSEKDDFNPVTQVSVCLCALLFGSSSANGRASYLKSSYGSWKYDLCKAPALYLF